MSGIPHIDVATHSDAGEGAPSGLDSHVHQTQKMEVVGRLAGGVAHDFNNLLTVILGYSDILISDAPPDNPHSAALLEIRRAAERAAELTRQLLAFSRRQVLELRILDLNRVVERLEKVLLRLIGEDIELRTSLTANGRVRADLTQLEVVVLNLAINARDAMPHGGKLLIETADVVLDEACFDRHRPGVAGPYHLLAVSDTGIGMDERTKSHLFEPFFTTKRNGQGTGLGLATVYGIVKQFGGHIWAYSEVGHGSTFKVYLPRADAIDVPSEPPAPVGNLHGTETILLVEDEEAVRHLAQRVLQSHGYKVLTARNGHDAVALYQGSGSPIHLLVTDVVMPQMSGPQLADKLAEVTQLGAPPRVLYCSGYTDAAILQRGILQPGTAFLQKPFTPHGLLHKVREVLGR